MKDKLYYSLKDYVRISSMTLRNQKGLIYLCYIYFGILLGV